MVDDQWDADPDLVDVGAEALGAKLAEVAERERLEMPVNLSMDLLRELARSVLEAAADEEREAAMVQECRAGVVENPPGPVNRMPNRVELLESGFLASRPPGMEAEIQARAAVRQVADPGGDRG